MDLFRIVPGATDSILRTLENFCLVWDDSLLYQSHQLPYYQQALEKLKNEELVYRCRCSRKQLTHLTGNQQAPYPGICRENQTVNPDEPHSIRLKSNHSLIQFEDKLQGIVTQNIFQEIGDFVLLRRDSIFSYHLATVIDDEQLGITEVLRGTDLLSSTPRQIYLQQKLGLTSTNFLHLPVLTNASGIKLSKQTFASPVENKNPEKTLFLCLQLLNQKPPPSLSKSTKQEIIAWGIENWNSSHLKHRKQIKITTNADLKIED